MASVTDVSRPVSSRFAAGDVEAIERATYAAVVPDAIEELDGWLLGFDSGTVGRAKSAAPLAHRPHRGEVVDAIAARYATRALPPVFRVATVPAFDDLRVALRERGFRPGPPTLVQIAETDAVRGVGSPHGVDLAARPDAVWTAAFLGEGFDPVDGASRARALARSADTVFGSVREKGAADAGFAEVATGAGAVSFGSGWAGIHGMRTARARRGEGIGARILAALAHVAAERGIARLFLQVEAGNVPALALYRRAGFDTAWTYEYWSAADDWRRETPSP